MVYTTFFSNHGYYVSTPLTALHIVCLQHQTQEMSKETINIDSSSDSDEVVHTVNV